MNFVRRLRLRAWPIICLAAALLAVRWITTVFAEASGGDGDGGDGDEFSTLAVVVGLVAIGAVGWFAYRGSSSRAMN